MRPSTKALATAVAASALAATGIAIAGSSTSDSSSKSTSRANSITGESAYNNGYPTKGAGKSVAIADLKDAAGAPVGRVTFVTRGKATNVVVRIKRLPDGFARSDWHGMHIHANDDPANGTGCIADVTQPSNTWFLSVDGHFTGGQGRVHGDHAADFPSSFVKADGTAFVAFSTDEFTASDVAGKGLLLHAGRDNYGNIPLGSAPDQYTANSPEAIKKTDATGNAGDRIACAVITKR